MDEMERAIALKAQRNALVYVFVALFLWTMWESVSFYLYRTNLDLLPCFLLVTTSLVQSFSQLILQKRAVTSDEEYRDPNPLWKTLAAALAVAAIIATVGCLLLVL